MIQTLVTLQSGVEGAQPPEGSSFGVMGSRRRCIKLLSLEAKSNTGLNCFSFVQYGTLDRAIEIPFEK